MLAIALLGYAFLGKGFAYVHVPLGIPFYVGEIVLVAGILAYLLPGVALGRALRTAPGMIFLVFAAWALLRTAPFLGSCGLDAVRDASVVYYGLFMFMVCGVLRGRSELWRVAKMYGSISCWFVPWVPVAFALFFLAPESLPAVPGTDIPVVFFKSGDMVVHLTGALAFSMLMRNSEGPICSGQRSIWWYVAAFLTVLILPARAAYLTFIAGLVAALSLNRKHRSMYWKIILVLVLSLGAFIAMDPTIKLPRGREVSVRATLGLARSVFSKTDDPALRESTKLWRVLWWRDIARETFLGPYFWTGRGFGANLAKEHGYEVTSPGHDVRPLRSPHNVHMTVLARMGVPGLVLWLVLQGALLWTFLAGWLRARRAGDALVQGVLACVVCYWVAFMFNATFDVYLEGPQGGIWFWSTMGLGLATAQLRPRAGEEPASYGAGHANRETARACSQA